MTQDRSASRRYPILAYHGVASFPGEGIENFSGKHVNADEFERHISFMREKMNPIRLREMADVLSAGRPLPQGSVAVTFDDSYKNIRDTALPILKKYGIPATFFISTGFIGTNKRFWTDRVEHIINLTKINSFNLAFNGQDSYFDLSSREFRIRAVIEIKGLLKKVSSIKRDLAVERLREKLGVHDNGDTISNYENLSWEDVSTLNDPPLYEIGGHTENHEILSYLDEERLNSEIFICLKDLKEHLGCPADLFSYPEGQADHFNDHVISILKKYGIKICPTAIYGFNSLNTDPFYLKRIMAGFMDTPFPFGAEFQKQGSLKT